MLWQETLCTRENTSLTHKLVTFITVSDEKQKFNAVDKNEK